MHSQLIEPPSSRTILEKSRVKASYLDFWNRIKNNEALLPVYSPDIIEDLFDRASEIVARIRILLNRQNPSAHILRNSCGFTTEKLWQGQMSEKPITNPEDFVRDLVHSSLQDAQGNYIQNLTGEKVNEYIGIVQDYLDKNRSQKEKTLVKEFKDNASEILDLVDKLDLNNECWKDFAMYLNLKKLASETANLKNKLQVLINAKEHLPSKNKNETKVEEEKVENLETTSSPSPSPSLSSSLSPSEKDTPDQEPTPMEETTNDKPTTDDENKEVEKKDGDDNNDTQTESSQDGKITEDKVTEDNNNSSDENSSSTNELKNNTGTEEEDSEEGSRTPTNTRKKFQIKINEVADDVSQIRGKVQHLAEVAERLDLSELAKNPKEGSRAVNDLQKTCLQYTEHLMKNLLSLDEIIGSTTARTQKKQQINTIQELMSDMDSVNERLKKLSETLKAEAAEEKEREENEKKRKLLEEQELKKKKLEEQNSQKKTKDEDEDKEDEEEEPKRRRIPEKLWRSLKLNANLEARELRDRFVIMGQLPGVKREDLSVDLSPNQTLTISGVRLPSLEEEELMVRHAQSAWAKNPRLRRRFSNLSRDEEERMIVEMASGRFGTFHETYRLPSNVDKQNISATLEKGTLQVVIPKLSPRRASPVYGDYNDLYW